MSGTPQGQWPGEGSGRRSAEEEAPRREPTRPCPPLEETHEACRAVARWVVEQLSLGAISPRTADAMSAAVAKVTSSLRADWAERELIELRDLVKRQEAVIKEIREREDKFRSAAVIGEMRPTTGRTRVEEK